MKRNISQRNIPRQFVIVILCALGMFITGRSLLKIDGIETLRDGLQAMVFFTCFFPFVLHTLSLIRRCIKSLFQLSTN